MTDQGGPKRELTDKERELANLLAAAMVAHVLKQRRAAMDPQPEPQPEPAPKRRRRRVLLTVSKTDDQPPNQANDNKN